MEINTLWPPRRGASSRVTWVWGVGVMGQSLTTKMSHAYRQPVMAGLGGGAGLEGPGTLYAPAESKLRRVETPFPLPPPHPSQCPPPHWGCPGRLHRCWHPNEKVNIEPKDLGVVEQLGAPREEVPVWDHHGLPKGKGALNHRGRDRLGNRPGETVGSDHCTHGRGGAFRVCSVLRSRPLEPPPPAAPSPGSAWTLGPRTVPLRPPGPHAAPPLILPSHFQRLKCLFFGQGRK